MLFSFIFISLIFKLKSFEDEFTENFLELSLKGEFLPATIDFYLQRKEILKTLLNFKLCAYARLISQNKIFESEYVINFICNANKKYQNHFVELTEEIKNLSKNKHTIVLSCALPLTLNKVKTFFDDEKLKFLGRRHNADDAIRLLDDAHNMGLRVSGDFIYGLPDENVDDVINTCKQINQLGLKHCSMY